jgi:hypothetical protein
MGKTMAFYFVGYDLTKKHIQQYENLIAAIKGYGIFWGNLDSTWLVETHQTAAQVRDNLWQHMHRDDRLLVIKLTNEAAWNGTFSQKASDWLKENLPRA